MKSTKTPRNTVWPYLLFGLLSAIFVYLLLQNRSERAEVAQKIKEESHTIGPKISNGQRSAVTKNMPKRHSETLDNPAKPEALKARVVEQFKPERKIVEHETLGRVVELTYPDNVKRYEFPGPSDE